MIQTEYDIWTLGTPISPLDVTTWLISYSVKEDKKKPEEITNL